MALSPGASEECSLGEGTLPLHLEMYVDSDNDDPMFLNGAPDDLTCTPNSLTTCASVEALRLQQHHHSSREQWLCPTCGVNFPTVFYLREHVKTHDELTPRDAVASSRPDKPEDLPIEKKAEFVCRCRICDSSHTSLNDLEKHMQTHPNNDPFQCTICKKEFVLSESLDVHMWAHVKYGIGNCSSESAPFAKSSPTKLHTCETCKKTFRNGSYFQLHLRTHTGDKTYACQICGKSFSCSWNLKTHLAVHRDEKPYTCSICGVGFKLKANMQRHERSHQPYERVTMLTRNKMCEDAATNLSAEAHSSLQDVTTSAAISSTLSIEPSIKKDNANENSSQDGGLIKNHVVYSTSHSNEHSDPVYSCSLCDKSFATVEHLKLHLHDHVTERPYSCSRCGMGFKVKANLVRHERLHIPPVSNSDGSSKDMWKSRVGNEPSTLCQSSGALENNSDSPQMQLDCFSTQQQQQQHDLNNLNSEAVNQKLSNGLPPNVHSSEEAATNPSENPMDKSESNALLQSQECHGFNSNNVCIATSQANREMPSSSTSLTTTAKESWKDPTVSDQPSMLKNESSQMQMDCYSSVQSGQQLNNLIPEATSQKFASSLQAHTHVAGLMLNVGGNTLEKLTEANLLLHNRENQRFNMVGSYVHDNPPIKEANPASSVMESGSFAYPSIRRHACKMCEKTYKQRCHLLSHMLSHSDQRPYVCDVCGKSFSLSWNLKTHLAVHNEEKPFICSICGNRFKLKTALQRHQRSHIGRHLFGLSMPSSETSPSQQSECRSFSQCSDSEGKTNSSDAGCQNTPNSVAHVAQRMFLGSDCSPMEEHHLSSTMRQKRLETLTFTCDSCGNTHLVPTLRNGANPPDAFACNVCGANFKIKNDLTDHSRACLPHTCNYCGKSFLETSALKCHIRIHTGERPYPCDLCGKRFVDSGALKRHVRIHTGEKPYTCAVCQKRFTTSTQLQIHTKMHS